MKKLFISLLLAAVLLLMGCYPGDLSDKIYYDELEIADELTVQYPGSLIRYDNVGGGGYWHEHDFTVSSFSKGASGATLVVPSALSVGGYQLNSVTEYVYVTVHIEGDISGAGPGYIELTFEVNIDNTGGNTTDVVVFDVESYHKALGDLVSTIDTHSGSTVVGKADTNKIFAQVITIDDVVADQTITFRINLDTVASDVDDVVLNFFEFKYQTIFPAQEVE